MLSTFRGSGIVNSKIDCSTEQYNKYSVFRLLVLIVSWKPNIKLVSVTNDSSNRKQCFIRFTVSTSARISFSLLPTWFSITSKFIAHIRLHLVSKYLKGVWQQKKLKTNKRKKANKKKCQNILELLLLNQKKKKVLSLIFCRNQKRTIRRYGFSSRRILRNIFLL
jgi:hypothetical protein